MGGRGRAMIRLKRETSMIRQRGKRIDSYLRNERVKKNPNWERVEEIKMWLNLHRQDIDRRRRAQGLPKLWQYR